MAADNTPKDIAAAIKTMVIDDLSPLGVEVEVVSIEIPSLAVYSHTLLQRLEHDIAAFKEIILNSSDKSAIEVALTNLIELIQSLAELKLLDNHVDIDFPGVPKWRLSRDNYNKIVDLIKGSQKIAAIREYRTITNMGLKESKDTIDALGVRLGIGNLPAIDPNQF
jgi:hypothetical protein